VALASNGAGTEMTVRVEPPASLPAGRAEEWWSLGVREGFEDTVDRLADQLARAASVV
jgi:hypothetical protein